MDEEGASGWVGGVSQGGNTSLVDRWVEIKSLHGWYRWEDIKSLGGWVRV